MKPFYAIKSISALLQTLQTQVTQVHWELDLNASKVYSIYMQLILHVG